MKIMRPSFQKWLIIWHVIYYISLELNGPFIKCQNEMWKFIGRFKKKRANKKEKSFQRSERRADRKGHNTMPTAAEIRESVEQASTRLQAFASRSMQQVRTLASRGTDCVQLRFIAFSDSCRGRKSEHDAQHWSTSERNSQARDSSKDNGFGGKRLKSACATKRENAEFWLRSSAEHAFQLFHVD